MIFFTGAMIFYGFPPGLICVCCPAFLFDFAFFISSFVEAYERKIFFFHNRQT